jgi:hypothetical protein
MAITTLAGEKSELKLNHASIESGNLSLIIPGKKKSILGKKILREPQNKSNDLNSKEQVEKVEKNEKVEKVEKKPINNSNINQQEHLNISDKSNSFIFFFFYFI